jgi:hypothetical protein
MRRFIVTFSDDGAMKLENEGLSRAEVLYASKAMEADAMFVIQQNAVDRVMKQYEEGVKNEDNRTSISSI